jgi:hypothetical protein
LSAGTHVFCSARRQRSLERVFPTASSPFDILLGKPFLTFRLAVSFFDRAKGSASRELSEPSLANMQTLVSTVFFPLLARTHCFFSRAARRSPLISGELDNG